MLNVNSLFAVTLVLYVVLSLPAHSADSKTTQTTKVAKTSASSATSKSAMTPVRSSNPKATTTSAPTHSLIAKASAAIKNRQFKTAHTHLKALAARGDSRAHNLLGMIYEHGIGVPKNMNTAISHYEFAAQRGLVSAQHRLGAIHFHGVQVPKDMKKAQKWLRLAAAQGSLEAKQLLEQIPGVPQAEIALQKAGDNFHQGGNQYKTGMNNLEHSWQGYADLVKIMQQVGTAAASPH